jgi:transcriptional regulator with XRE-family HTH domain
MFGHICFTGCMDKSIYTPEHAALQQVLRQLRHAANLRQEDLAARLDEPQPFVAKYESGQRRLDLIELRQICQALGVTLLELVTRFEEQLRLCSQEKNSSDSQKPFGPTSEQ